MHLPLNSLLHFLHSGLQTKKEKCTRERRIPQLDQAPLCLPAKLTLVQAHRPWFFTKPMSASSQRQLTHLKHFGCQHWPTARMTRPITKSPNKTQPRETPRRSFHQCSQERRQVESVVLARTTTTTARREQRLVVVFTVSPVFMLIETEPLNGL